MLLHNPFEEMIARVAGLEVPSGVGAVIVFTDGAQTKIVWQSVDVIKLLTMVRDDLVAKLQSAPPGGVPTGGGTISTN